MTTSELRSRIWTAAVVVLAAATLPAATLTDLAASIDRPKVGAVVKMTGPIHVGRALITPHSPEGAVQVLIAGGGPCGILIGPATLVYRVDDRFSIPVAERNLTRSRLDLEKAEVGQEIRAELEGAALWGWELVPAGAAMTFTLQAELPERVAKLLERPFFDQPHVDMILSRRLGAKGLVQGLLWETGLDLRLVVDPVLAREERLAELETVKGGIDLGRHYEKELVTQPIGRQWWEHEIGPIVAEHHDILVENDVKRHVQVKSVTRVRAQTDGVGVWWAELNERTIEERKEYPVRVLTVKVNGKPADHLFEGGTLLVALDPPLAADQTAQIEVVHEGEYAIRYGGDRFWSLGTWAWYPHPPLSCWLATMTLEVRIPTGYSLFVAGDTLSSETKDGVTVVKSELTKPMDWAVVAAGKYQTFEDERLGIRAVVGTYAGGDERGARKLANNFHAATQCYQRYLNQSCPFSEVEIVEINDWGYGQAPPGVIFMTQEAVNPLLEWEDRLYSRGVNQRFFHEVAHFWWPHIAKLDSEEENWTSESFAEYVSAVCLDELAEEDELDFTLRAALTHWEGAAEEVQKAGSIYLASHFSGARYDDREDYVNLLYAKGPLVLHALRLELRKQAGDELGEKQFWVFLRSYLKSFNYSWGGTRFMVAILDKITGKSWQPWFERYVYGTEMPPLEK